MLNLIDLLGKESVLNDMTAKLFVGRTVNIRGCVESGEFDLSRTVDDIEFVKNVSGNGRFVVSSIHHVRMGPFKIDGEELLDFSCISEMEIAKCSNPECRSEVDVEKDEDGMYCSRCGNIISEGLGDWIVYRVEATSDKVRLLRV